MIAKYLGFRTLRPWKTYLYHVTTTTIQQRPLNSTSGSTEHEASKISRQNVHPKNPKAPSPSSHKNSPLPEKVRRTMRQIPHPLTIILAQSKAAKLPSGLLVSSFNTITLSPDPYVSFNLKIPSATYDEIRNSGTFVASAISSVQVAKDFLLDKKDARYTVALKRNVSGSDGGKLANGRGGLWWMRCQYMERESVKVADHVVIIGKVVDTGSYNDDLLEDQHTSGRPLIYSEGRYRVAGEAID